MLLTSSEKSMQEIIFECLRYGIATYVIKFEGMVQPVV